MRFGEKKLLYESLFHIRKGGMEGGKRKEGRKKGRFINILNFCKINEMRNWHE
jgi:hypothetical protein